MSLHSWPIMGPEGLSSVSAQLAYYGSRAAIKQYPSIVSLPSRQLLEGTLIHQVDCMVGRLLLVFYVPEPALH